MGVRMQRICSVVLLVLALIVAGVPAFARTSNGSDQVRFGQNMTVQADENAGDVVCFGCSVRVMGTAGDVVVFGGNVTVEGSLSGDATVFGGNLNISPGANVNGDAVAFGGGVHRSAGARIGGDVTNFFGPIWVGAVFLPPIVVIILIGAFVVWLVSPNRRVRRPAPARPPTGQ